jgi:hypothetical protein
MDGLTDDFDIGEADKDEVFHYTYQLGSAFTCYYRSQVTTQAVFMQPYQTEG